MTTTDDNIFADLDLESAADDPFAISPGTYNATLTDITKRDAKVSDNGDEVPAKIVFEYIIDEDGEESGSTGMPIQEWFTVPERDDTSPVAKRQRSFLKRRMLSLGVRPEMMNTTRPEELVDTQVILKVKRNGVYTNVSSVSLPGDSHAMVDFPE